MVAIRMTDADTEPDMDPDPDPYRDTNKTCLGGGMHCPNASSCYLVCIFALFHVLQIALMTPNSLEKFSTIFNSSLTNCSLVCYINIL